LPILARRIWKNFFVPLRACGNSTSALLQKKSKFSLSNFSIFGQLEIEGVCGPPKKEQDAKGGGRYACMKMDNAQ
jgi:hypothetical protein